MTSQERRKSRKARIEERLAARYSEIEIKGERCFLKRTGEVFHIDTIGGEHNCLVIEFAESPREAETCFPDDGRLYYMDDMSEAEMFEAMIQEIEA